MKTQEPVSLPIKIAVSEKYGIARFNEPVTIGIPLRKGLVEDVRMIYLADSQDKTVPFQFKALGYWPDGSVKWLLCDFFVTMSGHSEKEFFIHSSIKPQSFFSPLYISQTDKTCTVSTGKTLFTLSKKEFKPFISVIIDKKEVIDHTESSCLLTDENGNDYYPVVTKTSVECEGSVRCTVIQQGVFCSKDNSREIDFAARLSFFSKSKLVKIQFILRNARAAEHAGNLWDLGDPSSFFFKKCSINLKLKRSDVFKSKLYLREGALPFVSKDNVLKIYQDSSGGENWKNSNHIDRTGKIPLSFQGYRVLRDDVIESAGHRTQPLMSLSGNDITVSCVIDKFWQNFPKSIGSQDGILRAGLFPDEFKRLVRTSGRGTENTYCIVPVQFKRGFTV